MPLRRSTCDSFRQFSSCHFCHRSDSQIPHAERSCHRANSACVDFFSIAEHIHDAVHQQAPAAQPPNAALLAPDLLCSTA